MDHLGILGAHLQQHTHVEPITFGIDQILSNVEQSCMLGMRMHEPDYGHAAYNSSSNGGMSGGFSCANAGYNGTTSSCGVASLGGAYMNMGVNANGPNVNATGVIRVPAHRPLSCGNSSAPPGSGTINTLPALTFPWMESNRRYTKDRFTGGDRMKSFMEQGGKSKSLFLKALSLKIFTNTREAAASCCKPFHHPANTNLH